MQTSLNKPPGEHHYPCYYNEAQASCQARTQRILILGVGLTVGLYFFFGLLLFGPSVL